MACVSIKLFLPFYMCHEQWALSIVWQTDREYS